MESTWSDTANEWKGSNSWLLSIVVRSVVIFYFVFIIRRYYFSRTTLSNQGAPTHFCWKIGFSCYFGLTHIFDNYVTTGIYPLRAHFQNYTQPPPEGRKHHITYMQANLEEKSGLYKVRKKCYGSNVIWGVSGALKSCSKILFLVK